MDAQISPEGRAFAFVREGELWIANAEREQGGDSAGAELRVSDSVGRGVKAGEAEYIIQEEFDRYTGYWWRKDPQGPSGSGGGRWQHQLLYEEVDERHVETVHIPRSSIGGESDTLKLPMAGKANATAVLCLARVWQEADCGFGQLERRVLGFDLGACYASLCSQLLGEGDRPGHEYLVRAGWMPSGERVWVQLLDRSQTTLLLLSISCGAFVEEGSVLTVSWREYVELIAVEQSKSGWVNVSVPPRLDKCWQG